MFFNLSPTFEPDKLLAPDPGIDSGSGGGTPPLETGAPGARAPGAGAPEAAGAGAPGAHCVLNFS